MAELGVHSGTVASILSRQDLILALGATQPGGVNHKIDILNGEIAHNAFDGKLTTKYYNPAHERIASGRREQPEVRHHPRGARGGDRLPVRHRQ